MSTLLEKETKLPPLVRPRQQSSSSGGKSVTTPNIVGSSQQGTQSTGQQPGLIVVRYGANKTLIANSFCHTVHLLNFIKKMAGCNRHEVIDLVSWGRGELQNIGHLRVDYAHRFLKSRETYLLVKVTYVQSADNSKKLPQYTSLLENLGRIHPELADRLEHMSRAGKSQIVKNKWNNMSRKGKDKLERPEKKIGLSSILAVENEKNRSGFIGVLAAAAAASKVDSTVMYNSSHSNSHLLPQTSTSNALSQVTKLPPLCAK